MHNRHRVNMLALLKILVETCISCRRSFYKFSEFFCTALGQHHCFIPHNVNKLPPLVIYLLMIPKIVLCLWAYSSPHFEGTFGAPFLITLNLVQRCEVKWYEDNQTPTNDVFTSWNSDKPDRICEVFSLFVTENTQTAIKTKNLRFFENYQYYELIMVVCLL